MVSTNDTLRDTLASEVREVIDEIEVLENEGTIGAYTLGSLGEIDGGTI
jgi:hypothetical protein